MRRLVAPALASVLAIALAACSNAGADELPQPVLPERILPKTIEGFDVREETGAAKAYRTSYPISLVADGKVFTLRRAESVEASLQIAVLKGRFRTTRREVARGIRASIENGRYRWFKLDGQWIGEQRGAEIGLYLWFPPGGTLYEVLVAKPELGIPKDLLRAIIGYQRGTP